MEMKRDEVDIFCIPDDARCTADEELRNPLDIPDCPLGYTECNGDCSFYAE